MNSEEEYKRGMMLAERILSRSMQTEKMLAEKLKKKEVPEDAIAYVIERMVYLGFLNDEEYARAYMRTLARRGYGAYRVKMGLLQKGVSRQMAEEVILEIETPFDKAIKLLDKKLRGDVSDRKENEKARAMLMRRGFSASEIRSVFSQYVEILEEEQTNEH